VAAGLENGKPINNIRIYIVNLNSSSVIAQQGDIPLQISCVNAQLESRNYDVSYGVGSLTLTSIFNDVRGNVSVPISSTSAGAIVHIETVVSNISIQRWIR
jgi:hypothetical protein